MIALAKAQIDTSIENLASLETSVKAIQHELFSLKQQKLAAEKEQTSRKSKLKAAELFEQSVKEHRFSNNSELGSQAIQIQEQRYFVLPNLEKKNEEAITDAINFFEKKCPYCGVNLYEGHVRSKLEIDHYIPITKGGQDVPWNILPVCKNAIALKRAKLPAVFLETAKRQHCENYLNTIRKRLVDEIQIQIEQYQQIKKLSNGLSKKFLSLPP